MGDLDSVANHSSFCSSSSLLGWEYHNLGVYSADMSHSNVPDSNYTPPYLTSLDNYSDYSTGYLQDALFEFGSKRRRLLLFSDDQTNYSTCPIQSFWKENFNSICPEDFGYLNYTVQRDEVSGKMMNNNNADVETLEEEARPGNTGHSSSCSANSKDSIQTGSTSETLDSLSPLSAGGGDDHEKRKKVMIMTRVVYPFDVVKPGGIQGDMTLNDINERISMPPTRPVMHPVGDFACKPIVSPHGPGLSGKPVVALTRVQTQGRGTITIIRTKG